MSTTLGLECLEDRSAPSSLALQPESIAAPAAMDSFIGAWADTAILYAAGQLTGGTVGIRYGGPDTVVVFSCPPAQYTSITGLPSYSTSRTIFPILGGEIPVIFVPTSVAPLGDISAPLPQWELSMFSTGWWYIDRGPDVPGPQSGLTFTSPDADLAIALLLSALGS